MNTFLPYQNFTRSAQCLDYRRLGKQRVEVLQLLNAINHETKGWNNHPAARMWADYLETLVTYGVAICDEWLRRGYKDTCREKILNHSKGTEVIRPPWLTREFCRAHQSNLLRKDEGYYRKFFPAVPKDLPYIWPVAKPAIQKV